MTRRGRAGEIVTELRRRRVFRVVLGYAAVAFVAWQIADIAFPALGIPEWGVSLVVVLSALGLPFAVVLSWAFDLTARGVVRTPPASESMGSTAPDDDGRDRWARVQDVFWEVVECSGDEREARLLRLTRDPAVRAEVRALLAAHDGEAEDDRLGDALSALTPGRVAPEVGSRFGQYRLGRRLGGGGMGVVYQAEDERLGRQVALKFLAPAFSADPTAKRRFLAEARAAAALDHPNICTILEVGEVDDLLFIAMPFYEGRTLEQMLGPGALEPGAAVTIARDVARGLAAAHATGIVHRDIKPANIIIPHDGVTKILDFGVAKVAHQSLTKTGAALGTVSYMSPEQTRGEVVDHRTDIWSLGVVLFEMLAGDRPFRGPTEEAIRTSILTSAHGSLSPRLTGSRGLDRIIDRALQKDPANRYATTVDLLEELEQLRLGEAVGVLPGEPEVDPGGLMSRGERRHVTALAVLIDGFDELVEQLPPESVETVLQQVRRAVGEAVTAEGGTVHSVQADRIECVFGIPRSHEDDPKRAVRAALELEERSHRMAPDLLASGHPLSIRSGIDIGPVAVQRDPEDESRYRIGRSVMERAVRLATEARADDILISEDCHRLVRAFLETEAGPEVVVTHDSGPMRSYRALELHEYGSSLEARASGGLTAFTGRADELRILESGLGEAVAGSGQIVSVVGEAGLGKSRLLYEFEHGVLDDRTSVLHGRCQSYGSAVAYLPFLEVLRHLLFDDDAETPSAELLEARVEELGPELADYVPFYLHLLSVPSDRSLPAHLGGDQLRLAIVESIAAILTVSSSKRPCTILLEDWHWADEASIATLTQLGELISAFPMLVVVTHRPGYGVSWDGVGNHRSVELLPLGADITQQLVRSALRVQATADDLTEQIHSRAQGNPFFIEEMCAALLEEGVISIREGRADLAPSTGTTSLPDSVQAVIRTRLDRMGASTREVLSAASVVGRDFTRKLVEQALPERADLSAELDKLRGAALVQQIRVVPDVTFRFKHALIQEVTYESLLAHERKRLHRRVGEAVEELGLEGEDAPYQRLADHFSKAGVWEKAVVYALEAARRAVRLSQIPEALQALDLADVALDGLPEEAGDEHRLDLLLMRERICETTGERKEQRLIIARLVELTRDIDDPAVEAEVRLRAGDLEVVLHNGEAAEAALMQALEKAEEAGDPATHRKALRSFGLLRWHQDRNTEALEILERVLESDRAEGDEEGIILDHHNLGSVYRSMGEIEKALGLAKESVRLAESSPFRKVYALHTAALCYRELGEIDAAIDTWTETITLCERHHLPLQQAYGMTSLAHLYLILGRTEESMAMYRDAVKLTRRVRHAEGGARAASAFAAVLDGLGRVEEALGYWVEAAAWLRQMEERDREAHARSRVAAIREALGEPQVALAEWATVRQLAAEVGDAELEFKSLQALGRLTRRHYGASALALPYYEQALALARELEDPTRQGTILNSLGVIAWESGDDEAARAHYGAAVEALRAAGEDEALGVALSSLGQTLRRAGHLEEARTTLLDAVEHNRVAGCTQQRAYGLAALGDTLLEQGDPDLALRAYEDSLQLRRSIGDRLGEGWMLQRLARTSHDLGQLDQVRELLTTASAIADQEGDGALQEACAKLRR